MREDTHCWGRDEERHVERGEMESTRDRGWGQRLGGREGVRETVRDGQTERNSE